MRRSIGFLAAACLVAAAGCSKDKGESAPEEKKGEVTETTPESGSEATSAAEVDPAALTEKVGVEAGPIQYDEDEGGAAVISATEGTVEVRRVGTETWDSAGAEAELREGDQVRTGDGATATVAFVDETAVELAEGSVVAVGSREATADPASSAAVLYGVARFSVAERAPGEGPFLVYTAAGVVATKGTVYTVGVAASGAARVGVESGEVEVAGAAKLDAPVAVNAGQVILIAPEGAAGSAEAAADIDWGAWRDETEAELEIEAAAELHAARIAALEAELEAAYAELEAQGAAAAEASVTAEAAAEADDTDAYLAAAPEIAGSVDASFALSLRLQLLSYAMLSHGYIAESLYVRHPEVQPIIAPARPRLAAAVLWHKRYHVVSDVHLEPVRTYYYLHHPRGRTHAAAVGFEIPSFYARARLAADVAPPRARVKVAVFQPPRVRASAKLKKRIFIGAPRVGWYGGVKARIRPAPIKAAWYVRPKAPRAKVIVGARASGKLDGAFGVIAPRPRAGAGLRFRGGIKAAAHRPGVRAGAGVKARVPQVKVKAPDARVKAGAKVRAGVKARVKAPEIKVKAPRVKAVGGVRAKAGGGARAGAGAGAKVKAGAGVRVKKPAIKAPKVKAKGSVKAKGGIKIGN
jgi:hypothetical protein